MRHSLTNTVAPYLTCLSLLALAACNDGESQSQAVINDDAGQDANQDAALPENWNDPEWEPTLFAMLPSDWQDMKPITLAMTPVQSDWDLPAPKDDPWLDLQGKLTLAVRDGIGYAAYVDGYGCGEPYSAYVDSDDDGYRVLLSHGQRSPNACGGATYTQHFAVGNADADTTLKLYIQYDLGGPIELLASAKASTQAGAVDVDCIGLTPCDADNPCADEGALADDSKFPLNAPADQRLSCTTLTACGGAVCAYTLEACVMQCGDNACSTLESYPLQIACEAL